MKKWLALITLVSLLAGMAATGFSETTVQDDMNESMDSSDSGFIEITPFYTYTSSVTASLSFSGNNANCSGTVDPSGTYGATVTVTLYKQNGSKWDYMTSWSGSSTNGGKASAGGSYSVSSGTYKVTTSGNVGSGKEYPSASTTKTK